MKLSNGDIRNGYEVKILNKTHEDKNYELQVTGLNNAVIKVQGAGHIEANSLPVFADSIGNFRVFITADSANKPREKIELSVIDKNTGLRDEYETIFVSKGK